MERKERIAARSLDDLEQAAEAKKQTDYGMSFESQGTFEMVMGDLSAMKERSGQERRSRSLSPRVPVRTASRELVVKGRVASRKGKQAAKVVRKVTEEFLFLDKEERLERAMAKRKQQKVVIADLPTGIL